jgi:hypothetical protein
MDAAETERLRDAWQARLNAMAFTFLGKQLGLP